MQNKIHLITYPDSLGSNLKDLEFILDNYLKEIVYGVHILPFCPSSSDRGFAPISYFEVDKKFGSWADIKRIAKKYDLTVDLIVNHISSQSKYFQDYLTYGDDSRYSDYFITNNKFCSRVRHRYRAHISQHVLEFLGRVSNFYRYHDFIFHDNGVRKSILKKIYRPRPGNPFLEFRFNDGSIKHLYCTFSADQIDLDIKNHSVRNMFRRAMGIFHEHGVKLVRLDAVAYAGKRKNTNGFFIEETREFLNWMSDIAHKYNIKVLPEVHHEANIQKELAGCEKTDFVYDFALPVLVLHTIFNKNTAKLKQWIKTRPSKQITVLDTHDGIGVIDVEGVLTSRQINEIVVKIKKTGGGTVSLASGENSENVDIYQINTTYFSALGCNEQKYLIARAIQFFVPGIPQVYYVGLFVGANDEKLLKKTGVGRDVNRHQYSIDEIKTMLNKKVVQQLFSLIKLRNTHMAFNGDFTLLKSDSDKLRLRWQKGDDYCELNVDLNVGKAKVVYNRDGKEKIINFQ